MKTRVHPNARYAPRHIAAQTPLMMLTILRVALELLILSNGLPPPLPTFPERCDCSSAGVRLVLLVALATVFDDVSTTIPVDDGNVFDVIDVMGIEVVAVDLVDTRSVLLGLPSALESVSIPVVTVGNDERTIVLCPIDGVLLIDIVTGPAPGVSPVVVVTTTTLHSNCIAFPIWNRPIMLVSSTSAVAQAIVTSALICTKPPKHILEHVCAEFVKS
jgi:hypothetical protein